MHPTLIATHHPPPLTQSLASLDADSQVAIDLN